MSMSTNRVVKGTAAPSTDHASNDDPLIKKENIPAAILINMFQKRFQEVAPLHNVHCVE